MTRNPRFVREDEAKVAKDRPLVLLCRSGKRSLAAAEALTSAGFAEVYNIAEGFEGDLDADGHRGRLGGWRTHGLPWVQD
jgi:rhodanese-related sulfurtransferase